MKKATGKDYTRPQLKNKWDGLKNEWKLWKQLKGKETGLGWNIKKNTSDATEIGGIVNYRYIIILFNIYMKLKDFFFS